MEKPKEKVQNGEERIKERLQLLRKPFEKNQISRLPKPTIDLEKWKNLPKGKCNECGGQHPLTNTIHLDYVGHAALTDRLLEADPFWNWEPLAFDEKGLPLLDEIGGLWIKLTICGITRLGYGDAQGKTGNNAMKERIGDALRNAAMRFGAALDLWHKGELHIEENGEAQKSNLSHDKSSPNTNPLTPSQKLPTEEKKGQNGDDKGGGRKTTNYKFLKVMEEIKKKVGDGLYYQVLEKNGYKHADEIVDRTEQEKIYRQLEEIFREMQQAQPKEEKTLKDELDEEGRKAEEERETRANLISQIEDIKKELKLEDDVYLNILTNIIKIEDWELDICPLEKLQEVLKYFEMLKEERENEKNN